MIETGLLTGILALQLGLMGADELTQAIRTWLQDRTRDLIDLLGERSSGAFDKLDALRQARGIYVAQAGANLLELLRRMPFSKSLCAKLRGLDDAELSRCLERISGPLFDREGTAPFTSPRALPPPSRFHRLREHAAGGLGVVFLASDREFEREVALKQIKDEHSDNPEAQTRFLLEAQVTGNLEHPGVVPVYSLWQEASGRPCYAMRFIRGTTLETAVQEFYQKRDGLPPSRRNLEFRRLLQSFIDVCRTADYAHSRGVLHRDIKPLNILLGKYGETLLIDWGLAKVRPGFAGLDPSPDGWINPPALKDTRETQDTLGTLEFSSPEQATGRNDLLGPRSDVYSLGATLYSILTGRRGPFDNFQDLSETPFHDAREVAVHRICRGDYPAPREIQPDLSPVLEAICRKSMALERGDRHRTAGDLAESIESWLSDQPVTAHRIEIERLRAHIRESPKVPDYPEGLARALSEIGLIYSGMARHSEAEEAFREALSCYRYMVGVLPAKISLRIESVNCRANLVRLLQAMGRRAEAEGVRAEGQQEIRTLLLMRPDDEAFKIMLLTLSMTPASGMISHSRKKEASEEEEEIFAMGIPGTETPLPHTGHRDDFERIFGAPFGGTTNVNGLAKFTITSLIGKGGMGIVYLARDALLQREVAIKVVAANADRAMMSRYVREAQVTSQLEHPSIVRIDGLFYQQDQKDLFMVLGLVKGFPLSQEIDRYHHDGARPEELRRLLKCFVSACCGVHYANSRGVIHGDPKPANIMVGKDGQATVLDWGLCKIMHRAEEPILKFRTPEEASLTETSFKGNLMGTPVYMAPEQFFRPGWLDVRTDVYILGVSLYQLLTGQYPHRGESSNLSELARRKVEQEALPPRMANPRIDLRLDAICSKAIHRDPAERYPTVAALADDVEAWLLGGAVAAHREGTVPRLWRKIRRKWSS